MSRDEVIANIGTIAKSGTRELVERIKKGESQQSIAELIGQFGVGFYSSFMAAERVVLTTRRAGETSAVALGVDGRRHLHRSRTAEKAGRGTTITLHLKPEDRDNGMDDFSRPLGGQPHRPPLLGLRELPDHPQGREGPRDRGSRQGEGDRREAQDAARGEGPQLHEADLDPAASRGHARSEYKEFYRHISHDWTEPLKVIPYKAEGRIEYQALLFIPTQAPYDLYYVASKPGLQLYVKRIQIMEKCEDLLPQYLRFVRGVVDSPDLALNVSREMLQQDRHITLIRKGLTKKVLDIARRDEGEGRTRPTSSSGASSAAPSRKAPAPDYENKERLLELLVFESSNDPEKLTTLKAYVERMKEGQNEIYYLTGESRSQVENSPHLEAFKEKGYEVLYLVDTGRRAAHPVAQRVRRQEAQVGRQGHGQRSASEEEKKQTEEELKAKEEEMKPLLDLAPAEARRPTSSRCASPTGSPPRRSAWWAPSTTTARSSRSSSRRARAAAPSSAASWSSTPSTTILAKLTRALREGQGRPAASTTTPSCSSATASSPKAASCPTRCGSTAPWRI